ncbi:MAG: hypothetical protein IJ038_04705 [Clostridia bacterium]|nr:hypothetical protein [Clostridia bacterium]
MSKESRKSAYAKKDDPNYYDYLVKPKIQGKLLMKRLLFILLYAVYSIGFCILCSLLNFWPLMCLVLVSTCIVVFFTWRYVSPEYSYAIEKANISFAIIYGGASRKELFTYHIKDIETIAPYSGEYKEKADSVTDAEKVVLVSSMDAYDIYYICATDAEGKKRVVLFEATEESKKLLRYYNENAIIVK